MRRSRGEVVKVPAWQGAVILLGIGLVVVAACAPRDEPADDAPAPDAVRALPAPAEDSPRSLEGVIAARRSVRAYADRALSDREIGQLLWAAQGVTDPTGKRAAPSAGATYPLEVYVVTAEGMAAYDPDRHALELRAEGDRRAALARAALGQQEVADAPAVVVIAAVYERTAARYGERAARYVHLEAGHAAQNVLLQAVSLDLAAVPIGAFADDGVARVLGLPADHRPLYLIPVGHPET